MKSHGGDPVTLTVSQVSLGIAQGFQSEQAGVVADEAGGGDETLVKILEVGRCRSVGAVAEADGGDAESAQQDARDAGVDDAGGKDIKEVAEGQVEVVSGAQAGNIEVAEIAKPTVMGGAQLAAQGQPGLFGPGADDIGGTFLGRSVEAAEAGGGAFQGGLGAG
ncbi:MAG TPA: hypothetical protein VMZ25_03640 [Terriglobales bacterium]|nr:hypothetical protein [Terriglobales bacterium]